MNAYGIRWRPMLVLALAGTFATSIAAFSGQQSSATRIAIRSGQLIDGTGIPPVAGAVILIENGRIQQITREAPPGVSLIDLSGYTVLPGLIDVHTHVTIRPGMTLAELTLREATSLRAIYGLYHAQKLLESGFTTIRDVGNEGAPYADVAVRDAIQRGLYPGPRMLVSTQAIAMSGSHDDIKGYSPDIDLPGLADIADGVEEIRKVVRKQIKYGADWIKVYVSGGVDTPGDAPEHQEYSYEEVRMAVEEARKQGKRVAAHASSPESIRAAVEAGAASIEHGSLIDEDTARLMAERGVFLVPTPMVLDWIIENGESPEWAVERAKRMKQSASERFPEILATGVKIAHGTEAGGYFFGTSARQLAIFVGNGMPAMQAIQSATRNAAELLGLEKEVGTIEPGKQADLIAVPGNPLEEISSLERVVFVMRGGTIHSDKRDGKNLK